SSVTVLILYSPLSLHAALPIFLGGWRVNVTLLGKRYRLRFVRMERQHGDCDPPDAPGKEIRIDTRLEGEELAETLIHEMLHAVRSEEHTSELQSRENLVCRLLL